jgi:hypothetical protein
MDAVHEDCFVVFVLEDPCGTEAPEAVEQEVISCSTYEEARRVRQEYHALGRSCLIRFVGPAGGGD